MAKEDVWQALKYPSEAEWMRISEEYPETFGKSFHELAPWLRLGWPSEDLWKRVNAGGAKLAGRSVASQRWSEMRRLYPDREGVVETQQDLYRVSRFWPDCFGQPMVTITLGLQDGITINSLTFSAGEHRVPETVAAVLRHVDATARQHFIDQFIPKVHQEKVLATLSMAGGGQGEVSE